MRNFSRPMVEWDYQSAGKLASGQRNRRLGKADGSTIARIAASLNPEFQP
jgi:hypothetical protein